MTSLFSLLFITESFSSLTVPCTSIYSTYGTGMYLLSLLLYKKVSYITCLLGYRRKKTTCHIIKTSHRSLSATYREYAHRDSNPSSHEPGKTFNITVVQQLFFYIGFHDLRSQFSYHFIKLSIF